jgi:hypothetical protein
VRMSASHAGLDGDVGKCAVAIVMEELVGIDVGNENVGATIVVVITDRDAHAIAGTGKASFFSDVGKCAVVVVAVEAVRVDGRGFFERRDLGAIDTVDVEEAVVVVVKERNAGDHGLGLILIRRGAVASDEVKAGLSSDLFKADGGSGTCRVGLRGRRPETARGKRAGRETSEGLEKPSALGAGNRFFGHANVGRCRETNQPSECRLQRDQAAQTQSLSTVIDRRTEERQWVKFPAGSRDARGCR